MSNQHGLYPQYRAGGICRIPALPISCVLSLASDPFRPKLFPSLVDKLVTNLTRGRNEKLRTAIRQIQACVWDWVVEGHSIIELSPEARLTRMRANLERNGNLTDNRPKSQRESYLPHLLRVKDEKEILPYSPVWTTALKTECIAEARAMKWLNG